MIKYLVDKGYLVKDSCVSYENSIPFNTYEEAKKYCLDNMIFLEENEVYDILEVDSENETTKLMETVAFEEANI